MLICDLIRGDVGQGYTHGIHEGVFDGEQLLRTRSGVKRWQHFDVLRGGPLREVDRNVTLQTPRFIRVD